MSLMDPSCTALTVSFAPFWSISSISCPDMELAPIPRIVSPGRSIPSRAFWTSSGLGTNLKLNAVCRQSSSHCVKITAVTTTVTTVTMVSPRTESGVGNSALSRTHATCSFQGLNPVGSASSISSWVMSLVGSYSMAGTSSSGPLGASLEILVRSSCCTWDSSSMSESESGFFRAAAPTRPSPFSIAFCMASAWSAAISSADLFSSPIDSARFLMASLYLPMSSTL
mmetsp:Transcript_16079/g.34848  ORF Transcript_16079/g.34848 Transcript_16079/m.34848 type:complete len:226 (-) Transcript_16079:315-992(-)